MEVEAGTRAHRDSGARGSTGGRSRQRHFSRVPCRDGGDREGGRRRACANRLSAPCTCRKHLLRRRGTFPPRPRQSPQAPGHASFSRAASLLLRNAWPRPRVLFASRPATSPRKLASNSDQQRVRSHGRSSRDFASQVRQGPQVAQRSATRRRGRTRACPRSDNNPRIVRPALTKSPA